MCLSPPPLGEADSGRIQELPEGMRVSPLCTCSGQEAYDPDCPIHADAAKRADQWIRERGVYKVPGSNEEVGSVGNPASYYNKGGMQPFDIIDAFGLDFYEGSALKYLLRWRDKDGEADLLKVIHYVQEIIARHRKEQQHGHGQVPGGSEGDGGLPGPR